MQKPVQIILGMVVLVVIVIAGALWLRKPAETVQIDLISMLGTAEKRHRSQLPDQAFTVSDVTINGETMKAIFAPPHSRIIWTLSVPRDAFLQTSFAMRPDSWDADGNGAQFRIGTSGTGSPQGPPYEEHLRQVVNPRTAQGDRRWMSMTLDLSAYEGQTIRLIFNTDPGPPNTGDTRHDFALWGEPRIVSQ